MINSTSYIANRPYTATVSYIYIIPSAAAKIWRDKVIRVETSFHIIEPSTGEVVTGMYIMYSQW